ncbi:hypothetical protein MASR2M15_29010 [Anaerolineales bacterium]
MDNSNNKKSSGLGPLVIIPIIAFVLVIILGAVLITAALPSVLPEQASVQAERTDGLFQVLMFLGGAIFMLVQGLLLFSIFRFRARAGDTSDGPPQHGNVTLEIVWTIIPIIIVSFLAIYSWTVWNDNITPHTNENLINGSSIAIDVEGARFAWKFTYETGMTTGSNEPVNVASNVFHTYVGQNVKLNMHSVDVIHSFWVPAMRVKQDVIPGRVTEVRFTPVKPDSGYQYTTEDGSRYNEYRIVCAELCGSGHGQMFTYVIVWENEESFLNNFYDPQVDVILNPPADPVVQGSILVNTYPCRSCHKLDSQDWVGNTGPTLNGIGERAASRDTADSAEAYLVHSLYDPNRYIVEGFSPNIMPHFGVEPNPMSEEDLYAIVAYLCSETDGAESSCDMENLTLTIPTIIEQDYGLIVDISTEAEQLPQAEEADLKAEATLEMEDTAEPTPAVEATAEITPEAEATESVSSVD